MRPQLEKRLVQLRTEFESGQKMLADAEIRQAKLRDSLLRISGAMQLLEELLAAEPAPQASNVEPLDAAARR